MSFLDGFLNKRCDILGIPRSQVVVWRDPESPLTYTLTYNGRHARFRVDLVGSDHENANAIENALQSLIEPVCIAIAKSRAAVHVRLSNRRSPVSCRHWFSS